MLSLLSVIVALLALVTGANLLLCFAVIRRVRGIEEGDRAPTADADLPPVGTPMAAFAATTIDGDRVTDAQLRTGGAFVGVLKPGCPACETFVSDVERRRYRLPAGALLVVAAGATADAAGYVGRLRGHAMVVVATPPAPVLAAFGDLRVLPMFVRLHDGMVAAVDTRAAPVLRGLAPAAVGADPRPVDDGPVVAGRAPAQVHAAGWPAHR